MHRREFLARMGLLAAYPAFGATARSRPNVLFLFADDLDPGCIGALGSREARTPNIDRLAARGAVFANTYNMGGWHGAICVASRTMLMTGAYLWRAKGLDSRLDSELQAGRLWPLRMADAGYATCFSGKWHVAVDPEQVFQHTAHVRPGGMPFLAASGYNRPPGQGEDPWHSWDTAEGGFWEGGRHWSEVVADDAESFLAGARTSEKPFFMYLSFNAPHDPRQSPKEFLEQYPPENVAVPKNFLPEYPFKDAIGCAPDLRDEKLAPFPRTETSVKVHRAEYYAIIAHLDAQVGRILAALDASGFADNTLVVFSADNGLACGQHGLMGKQNMFEHSMRVPLIVAGPGIPRGARIAARVYMQDIVPTLLEIADVAPWEGIEYRSLMPLLRDDQSAARDAIYGAYMDLQRMLVMDGFKLVHYPAIEKWLLFDLANDPWEMRDLSEDAAYAVTLNRLRKHLRIVQHEMRDPLTKKETGSEEEG